MGVIALANWQRRREHALEDALEQHEDPPTHPQLLFFQIYNLALAPPSFKTAQAWLEIEQTGREVPNYKGWGVIGACQLERGDQRGYKNLSDFVGRSHGDEQVLPFVLWSVNRYREDTKAYRQLKHEVHKYLQSLDTPGEEIATTLPQKSI